MPNPDRTAAIAGARYSLGYTDGAREAAIAQTAQFAIDQMIGDQTGINCIVSER